MITNPWHRRIDLEQLRDAFARIEGLLTGMVFQFDVHDQSAAPREGGRWRVQSEVIVGTGFLNFEGAR